MAQAAVSAAAGMLLMPDVTPLTTVLVTWNPSDKGPVAVLSNGNLTATSTGAMSSVRSTVSQSSGKFYFETTWTGAAFNLATNSGTSIANSTADLGSGGFAGEPASVGPLLSSGAIWNNGSNSTVTIGAIAVGDIICCAVDLGAKLVWFRDKGGNWNGSGTANPATGAGGISISWLSTAAFVMASVQSSSTTCTANFGASSFAFTVPGGYSAWNTQSSAFSYDYESSNAAPGSGIANQHTTLSTIAINKTDHNGIDQSSFLNTVNNSSTLTINGVTYNILAVSLASGVYTLTVSPPVAATPYGVTNISFVISPPSTAVGQPISAPIIPPPTIGNPIGVPAYPPPTPPPIGAVPVGPLVGPAVANAAVPPSTAGFPLVRYQSPGSATVPTAASLFPAFTTGTAYAGFPNNPPAGVPIVFANVWANPTLSGGVWTAHPPASTATTGQIILNGWGLPGPSGLGPGPPSNPNPPGAGLPHLAAMNGDFIAGTEYAAQRPGKRPARDRNRAGAIQSGHAESSK